MGVGFWFWRVRGEGASFAFLGLCGGSEYFAEVGAEAEAGWFGGEVEDAGEEEELRDVGVLVKTGIKLAHFGEGDAMLAAVEE